MGTDLGFFEYLEQDTKAYKDFDTFMMASRQNRPIFADWFPVQAQIVDRFQEGKEGKSDNDVLIVDVGGGRGQDLEMFRKRFPQAPGRMVLQDLPRTVADAKLSKGVEGMAYDFLTPQPVKGKSVTNVLAIIQCPQADLHLMCRRLRLFLPLHSSQLARPPRRKDFAQHSLCHETRLLQDHPQRVHLTWQGLSSLSKLG